MSKCLEFIDQFPVQIRSLVENSFPTASLPEQQSNHPFIVQPFERETSPRSAHVEHTQFERIVAERRTSIGANASFAQLERRSEPQTSVVVASQQNCAEQKRRFALVEQFGRASKNLVQRS